MNVFAGTYPLELRVDARLQLFREWFNKHDHHSHHVHGYYEGPNGQYHVNTPEEREDYAAPMRRAWSSYWRKRYKALLRDAMNASTSQHQPSSYDVPKPT